MTTPLSRKGAERFRSEEPVYGCRCHACGSRLDVLVRIEPQAEGPPVTYYACERCSHVLICNL